MFRIWWDTTHILGKHWPPIETRRKMLEEAVEILRLLWQGGEQSYCGEFFTVENAEIFSRPEKPPPIMIAAANAASAELAGTIGDGLISTIPNDLIVRKFRASDDSAEKPCFGQMTVCWAETEEKAKNIAKEFWPVGAVPGKLMSELATPDAFEATARLIDAGNVAAKVICGPDPEKFLEKIRSFADAGFDHVYIHQVGPNQEGFFHFYERELAPRHI